MYVKERLVKGLKIKNVLFLIAGVCEFLVSSFVMLDLLITYRDDLDTALHAKAMPSSIRGLIVSVSLLLISCISRKMIGEATFYSSYFEGSLDGYIQFDELSKVMGRPEWLVRLELRIYRVLYMKKFSFVSVEGLEQVELFSKKSLCECKNCGAGIEKRVYFTGQCSYCGSSDLYAKVLAGDRFYSISNTVNQGISRPSYYRAEHINSKRIGMALAMVLVGIFGAIMLMFGISQISHYNDTEYLRELLLDPSKHYASYALIKKQLVIDFAGGMVFGIVLLFLFFRQGAQIILLNDSSQYAVALSKSKQPYMNASAVTKYENGTRVIKKVRKSIRKSYLRHCTLEYHDDALKIALAKKIVKDHCPSCASPIVGAVDENYVCQVCGNKIMGVVVKQ